jgi:hypothetical protein
MRQLKLRIHGHHYFLISFAGSGQKLEAVPNAFIDVNRGAHADILHYYYQLNVFIICY